MFGKLESSLNPQGCGLGLSIASMIVLKLGGTGIEVTSAPHEGATFSFTIPIINSEAGLSGTITPLSEDSDLIPEEFPRGCEISPHGKSSAITKAEVLIVDDSPFNRLVVKKMLEAAGFSFAEASTGLEAVHAIMAANEHGIPFSVIIMDIEMPEMDGISATRQLKSMSDSGLLRLPLIIGCSAFSTDDDKAIALSAGMSYYLEKPVSRQRLIQLISNQGRFVSPIMG